MCFFYPWIQKLSLSLGLLHLVDESRADLPSEDARVCVKLSRVFPPSVDDFLSFAQRWAGLTLGLEGSFAHGLPGQQSSLTGQSKGHALLHPIFIQGNLLVNLPLSFPQLLPKDKKKQLIIHYSSLK